MHTATIAGYSANWDCAAAGTAQVLPTQSTGDDISIPGRFRKKRPAPAGKAGVRRSRIEVELKVHGRILPPTQTTVSTKTLDLSELEYRVR
ncbi:MAG: hypothetical protein U5P10_08320 [Spirochaetia bacterium]|nr:hypothetical protein [Spirochaetia bacterium]